MQDLRKNLIGGQWVSGTAVPNINPSDTDDVVGEYARGTAEDTQTAIEAASDAKASWALSGIQQRHDILKAAGDEIMARRAELGALLAREEGKPLAEGIGETVRAANIFHFFAAESLRIPGEFMPSVRPGIDVEVTREPVGVVGVITPWNFPIAVPAWKIAPALCYGNTVVFKPAELAPGCAWEIVDILHRAGLPDGVLNLVMGKGSVVGETMLASPQVDALSFTGSAVVGKRVAAASIDLMRKVQVEMGGKNPLVILDDADLDVAVRCAVEGSFYSTGQRCTASSRLIVTEEIHDRFLDALVERLEATVVDHALKDGTQIGPVVDQSQLAQDESYIRVGQEEGGRLYWGGERLERDTKGHFLQPALLTETSSEMRINREEVFGPVAAVIQVGDYEEALAVANDTPYGLSAGICTTSLKLARHFKRHAEAGMVMVNLPTAGVDYHVPFGGRKASSYGPREQGRYAVEFYTNIKTAYTTA